jgi:mannonate dehydratase
MRIEKSQMDEESHCRQTGRADHAIVFRPDHEHELLSDIGRAHIPAIQL